eukprot:s581_g4.t1
MAEREMKRKMVSLMDLTTLDKEGDTEDKVKQLVEKGSVANALQTEVAAVCVYPEFVAAAKEQIAALGSQMRVATVVNFPSGDGEVEQIKLDTKAALDAGADEIDLVICYKDYLQSAKSTRSCQLVHGVKGVIQQHGRGCLKVILETGELKSLDLIQKVADDALQHGADFLKTSTGKTSAGASLEAARAMLQVIKAARESGEAGSTRACGLKISGGVRTFEDALGYIRLVEEVLPDSADFLRPETFRFGVSGLLANLLREDAKVESSSAY